MIERDTELQITSDPAIAYSTCYRLPFLSLFHADCMEIMKQYPDKYFDLAICDPPYTDEFRVVNSGECAKLGDYKTDSLNNNAPTDEYFKEVIRVSKNQIIWGVNYYKFYLGVGRIVWDKDNTGNYSDCELAYHSFGNVVRKFKWRWNGMLQGDMKDKQIRIHPTEKPKQLYSWLLKKYAKQDQTQKVNSIIQPAQFYLQLKHIIQGKKYLRKDP